MGSFAEYADRFAAMDPVFEEYAAFDRILRRFAEKAECTGCRTGECLLKGCKVQTCVKDKGVDFCFQCQELV